MTILVERHDLETMNVADGDLAIATDLLAYKYIDNAVFESLCREYRKATADYPQENYLSEELDYLLADIPHYRGGPTFILADSWKDETLIDWLEHDC